MISPRQVRAARALLDWTQADLAAAAGLHFNAVNKIEAGRSEPRLATMGRIRAACEGAGVQFQGQRGVILREDVFETRRFEGAEFMRGMTNDFLSIAQKGDEVLSMIPDETMWDAMDAADNRRYVQARNKIGFTERMIVGQHHAVTVMSKSAYRWLPEKLLGKIVYNLYKDRVCFTRPASRETLIIRSASLAEAFRAQYEFLWAQGKPFI